MNVRIVKIAPNVWAIVIFCFTGFCFGIKSKSPCVYLGLKAEVCSGLLDAQDTTLP